MREWTSLSKLVGLVEQDRRIYVRYSRGPDADVGGGSRDFEADVDLPGWSASVLTPEPWWPRPARDWVARRLCKYLELARSPGCRPWLLTGREVGSGPDHEPLITDVEGLGWVADKVVEEARAHYHQAFHVGQDAVTAAD